ncbi:MAG: hypothetical protein IJC71_07885 [Clostridia bacterium]|nr:hypothetical protein [Clostridia bacterium]
MGEGKVFRTQISGFNKNDVNNYIKETDEKHTAECASLREEIAGLTEKAEQALASLSEVEKQLADAQSAADELRAKLTQKESELTETSASLVSAQKELAEFQKATAFYKSESETQIRVMASQKEEIKTLTDKLEAEQKQSADELAAQKERVSALENKAAGLLTLVSEKDQQFTEMDNRMQQLAAEAEQLKAAKDALLQQNDALSEEIRNLREEAEKAAQFDENTDDKNSPAYKIGMYDKISSQLGDILITANRDADDLLTAAKEEAERMRSEVDYECETKRAECDAAISRIKTETEEEAAYIRERLSQTANELLTTVSSDLHGSIENCVREINTSFTDIQYEFRTLLSRIANRSSEMNDRVNYYQSCVSDGIEEKLAAMDEKYGNVHSKKNVHAPSADDES